MTSARLIPPETLDRQRRASDPRVSVWVSANAGSGKTTVLTRRVIRLLLDNVPPSSILCLTFTKAAAANMQNRIFKRLGDWAAAEDAALASAIEEATGVAAQADDLLRARRLFARAVETPGGLKVLTIHAFCEKVLHLFPFEANVPAQFTVLEDRAAAELLEAVRQSILVEANRAADAPLGKAFAVMAEEAGAARFDGLLAEITGEREAIRAILRDRGPALVAARLRRLLGLAPDDTVATVEAEMDRFGLDEQEWPEIAACLRSVGQAKMTKLGDGFAALSTCLAEQRPALYRGLFLTGPGEPRSLNGFLTNPFLAAHPALADEILAEHGRIADLVDKRRRAACAGRTEALLTVAEVMITRYGQAKRARAALDFDDLVARTLSLLLRAGADWVLYKLDRGIDHILVDEAQDTSPSQWRIVELLSSEFTAGAGARGPRPRTVFAVGDEKQSIFSFQGAAPAEFARMRGHFETAHRQAALDFASIELKHSFRSTLDILKAVDTVFAVPAHRAGLSSDDVATLHETVRGEEPGRVEVWPVVVPEPAVEIEAWDAPFDVEPASSPMARAARRVARSVATLIRDGDPATGQRFSAGDVMVLVRSRSAFFEAVIRALKREGIPVAGADRLILMDHIAVMDLVALLRFTLLPSDDLTLATLLKSPLIGLGDDDLIRLAPGRPGTLWEALRQAAVADAAFRAARDRLERWIDEAAFRTPFSFLSDVLARDGGRRALLARLGHEAADAIDELLGLASAFERGATPSLEGFVAWLMAARSEIKRDMDVARAEVRVMTVHGAKGLEAKVVVLADTCTAPSGRHDPSLFWVEDGDGPSGAQLLVWSPSKAHDAPPAAAARAEVRREAEAEHRRLLYVAMTRAEDRLIVSGHEGETGRPAGSWYDMIRSALAEAAREEPMPDGDGCRLVFEVAPRKRVAAAAPVPVPAAGPEPDWLRQAAPAAAEPVLPLSPSAASDAAAGEPHRPRGEADAQAAERGRLIHLLIERLPGLPAAERAAAGHALMDGIGALAGEAPELIAEALAVVGHPALAAIFAPGSRAEVPIIGRLPGPGGQVRLVSGRIDRLAMVDGDIVIGDFKTQRRPPAGLADVPEATLTQLALYRAVLSKLYPRRAVRAVVVYTAAKRVIEVPEAELDRALSALVLAEPAEG